MITKKKVLAASAWVIGGHVFSQLIRFLGNLILTRLLFPEYFGLVGVALILVTGIIMFSDLGIKQCVIKSNNGKEQRFLSTAWTIQILRGIFLGGFMLALSIGLKFYQSTLAENEIHKNVYSEPLLPEIIIVLAIMPVILGFLSPHMYMANRDLDLKRIAIIEVISGLMSLFITVVIAATTKSIWSLVSGIIISGVTKTALSLVLFHGPSLSLLIDREHFREIFNFGKWIMVSSMSGFLLSQGDRALLGYFLNAETLGIYTIGYFLINAAYQVLLKLNGSVFFPYLSNVSRKYEFYELGNAFYRLRARIDMIGFMIAGTLMVSGESVVAFLYDSRYYEAGWILQLLALSVLAIIPVTFDQLFLAIGKSKWMTMGLLTQMFVIYLGIPIAFSYFEFPHVVMVIALAFIPRYFLCLWFARKIRILKLSSELKGVAFIIPGILLGVLVENILEFVN